jgi:energy-coupling factor transport system ATP-binding protein
VLDEVCFGPENRLVAADEVEARAEQALRRVGLWDRRHDDPATLSGGGKQRLAIACALAMDAPVLVLDEPTANLDPVGAEEVYRLLAELTTDGAARSVVLVEHDLDLALAVADTVLVLDGRGRTIAHGPVREVLQREAGRLAAEGVWLPTPALAALRLRGAGLRLEPLPLTPDELTAALAALPEGAVPTVAPRPETPRAAAPMVSVHGLTVRRGGREVVRDVSLEVAAGEFLALLGPNGAGKSTLVEAIAGIGRPPRGVISVAGVDPARRRSGQLGALVGFVFQNPEHQFVATTVEDELAFGLRRRGLADEQITERVERMLGTLRLADKRGAHPFRLSGGQKRRLSVGTALIEEPALLVLDEPTYGLDRAAAVELLGLLDRLNAAGTTVIVVTHDLGMAAEHAHRVAVMDAGRIVAAGATEAVLSDRDLLAAHGLRMPPLLSALSDPRVPRSLRGVSRLADLPGGDRVPDREGR